MFELGKFSLLIVTRCNLRCRLCCEYVPQNKPFPDMTVYEGQKILDAFFHVVDHVNILHLTGGGEPFLHPDLVEMIELAMSYGEQFDRLMIFTNCTVRPSVKLLQTLQRFSDKVFLQVSQYHIFPEKEAGVLRYIQERGINYRVRKYYGDDQSFGGWVDFGLWDTHGRSDDELEQIFHGCSVTNVMHGNWRTRDGKVHWCSRSQRGMDLGLIPDEPEDYVDLFDDKESVEQKREKFLRIANSRWISACNYCSGDQGTADQSKRYPAAEQMK